MPVRIDRRGDIAIIILDRPDRLNAFTRPMLAALTGAFTACGDDAACRAIVLTGAGRAFCAGQDLGEIARADGPVDLGAGLEADYNPLVLLMRALDKPIIAAVNGIAAGAGANVALAADFVIAGRSAAFLQAFARLGLVPDAGGSWWLTRHLGEPRAKALTMLAEPLPAETAADWGLIHAVVDDAALMAEAEALAGRLACGSATAFALTKRAIHAASEHALEAQLAVESDLQRLAGQGADFREGVAAFLAKRPPDFRQT